ncbi:pentatricopeptide repeat-containing protein At2g01390-like [Lolium rigidum]|uniref:pentatricopeptide repeat-containing protein At2g01390-like n=1 Tax=Lolium rigidum TaxID=89674 RepID=UPI001F5E2334|nr:pentatricopeptide repeat-containing protein At2g01390-like [Lolium rigidum]
MLRRPRHFLPAKHRRRPKPQPKQPAEPPTPTYTRDIVRRVTNILRDHPWSAARPLLLSLPGLVWDSHTVARVLKTHPPLQKAFLFFRLAASPAADPKAAFRHDRYTYTSMLHLLGEAGRVPAMLRLLAEMLRAGVDPDAATFTTVMHWLGRAGDVDAAMSVWEEMRSRRGRCRPTLVSYTACVKILFDAGRAAEGKRVFEEMVAEGLRPSCTTYTVLIQHLADAGKFEATLEIMSDMQDAGVEPDKALCNILVQKCSRAGETSVMAFVLKYMKEKLIVLRRPIFLEALEALKASGESDNLLREVNPHLASEGIECDQTFSHLGYITDRNTIMYLLAARNWSAIEQMTKELATRNVKFESHILADIIQASCANCRPSCGLAVLHYSLRVGNELDRSAYSCLLGQYIRSDSFDLVLKIVEGLIKSGCNLGSYLLSVLILRLGCAGHSSYAAKIFGLSSADQNVTTYTALMNAYFQAGEVDKALKLWSQMKTNEISACAGTYEVLIYGLQKAGRKHDSEHYRRERMEMQWHRQYCDEHSPEDSLCNHLFCGFHG